MVHFTNAPAARPALAPKRAIDPETEGSVAAADPSPINVPSATHLTGGGILLR